MAKEIEVGKQYVINSSRKGVFNGKLIHQNDEWATFEITSCKANAMMEYNVKYEGEQVTVRKSFCTFNELNHEVA